MFQGITPLDMAADITSNVTNVEQLDKISIHAKWTAGPAGEFKLEARNGGRVPSTPGMASQKIDDSWYELNLGVPISILAADSEFQIVLNECPFTDIRLRWIAASGSATDLQALISAKTVSA